MPGARDHQERQDDRSAAGAVRRSPEHAPGPALAGRGDPRLAHAGAETDLVHLQRAAGNAAVSSLMAPAVQRSVTVDEIETEASPGQGTAQEAPGFDSAPGEATHGAVTITGGATEINGTSIRLNAPMVEAAGVIRTGTIIADNVVGSNYTPGAGNVW